MDNKMDNKMNVATSSPGLLNEHLLLYFLSYLVSQGKIEKTKLSMDTDRISFSNAILDVCNDLKMHDEPALADFLHEINCWQQLELRPALNEMFDLACHMCDVTLIYGFHEAMTRHKGVQFMPERVYKAAVAVLTNGTRHQSFMEFSTGDCSCQTLKVLDGLERTCFVTEEDAYFQYQMLLYLENEDSLRKVTVIKCDPDFSNNMTFDCVLMDTIWLMSGTAGKGPVSNSFYWTCINNAVHHIAEGGKAVVLVPTSILTSRNKTEERKRKKLLNDGLIETVFAMPKEKVYDQDIEYSLVVLGTGNTAVRMIDLSFFCVPADIFRDLIECQYYCSKACSSFDVVEDNSKLLANGAVLDARIQMHSPQTKPVFLTTFGGE